MVNAEQVRFLLSDQESLGEYNSGIYPSFEDVRRRLFLIAREQNRSIPDSYYLLAKERSFKKIDSNVDLLTSGLTEIAEDYLELNGNSIFVKTERQTQWQELITFLPPLLLQASFLHAQFSLDKNNFTSVRHFFSKVIFPNTKYTALPKSRIPQLDDYINQHGGLHDLHMHLNGALETDQVWQDYLFSPKIVYHDLKDAFQIDKVREQLEQESQLLRPESYVSLLFVAQRLRRFFHDFLFTGLSSAESIPVKSKSQLLANILKPNSKYHGGYSHPFLAVIRERSNYPHLMSVEALMYVLLFQELTNKKNEALAGLFHFYLLILGLTNRLLVQQTHQNGFDQFQKHTLNGLREQSEKTYMRRYFQMNGNDMSYLHFLEGRFSPKKSEKELIAFINQIWDGWSSMCSKLIPYFKERGLKLPELRLIAHFIKRAEKSADTFIRHKEVRRDIWQRGKILALLLRNNKQYRKKIVGIDAAANEFDASPEVFAPVFRYMRRSGVKHFTYHAGEDFYHITGGLRAIYEAILFCDLRKGDRIGHAVAAGLSVSQWGKIVGDKIMTRKGFYLDDLVFVYHLIVKCDLKELLPLIPRISDRIQNLYFQVFKQNHSTSVIERAWLMRQFCPFHILESEKSKIVFQRVFNQEEWMFPLKQGFFEKRNELLQSAELNALQQYHNKNCRKEYEKIIEIDPFEILTGAELELLQLALLAEMSRREIVIETLPTSNVRIGFHRDYSTYHIHNWIRWREQGKMIPPIVVGSDDTGIFATNIYNEYANIYCTLLYHHKMPHDKIMDVIKMLDENSRIYRFE